MVCMAPIEKSITLTLSKRSIISWLPETRIKAVPIILMCASGSRSPVAAGDLYDAGYQKVYFQVEGFEGIKAKQGPDKGKRVVNGWKNSGLPWGYHLKTEKMYFNFAPSEQP